MNKQFQILFYFLVISFTIRAQPAIEWQRCYGGSNNDFFLDAVKTLDNGIIATIASGSADGDLMGVINSAGWVMKFDSLLEFEWQKFYSNDSYSSGPVQPICLENGDYIFGGNAGVGCNGFHGGIDFFLLKTNSFGDTLWSKCYGSPGNEEFKSILKTEDNGFLITGTSYSSGGDIPFHYGIDPSTDIVILKTDSIGNLLWLKNLGGSNYDNPLSNSVEISRGKYQIHLYAASSDYDLVDCPIEDTKKRWIIEIDSAGNIVKQNFMSAEDDLYALDGVLIAELEKTIVVGSGNSESILFPAPEGHGSDDGAIAIFDTSLNMINMFQYGGSGLDRFGKCSIDSEGNYNIFGFSESADYDLPNNYNSGNALDYWILKIDSMYIVEWSKNFGGSELDGDLGGGILHGNIVLNNSIAYVLTGAVTPTILPDFDIECGHPEATPELFDFMDAWLLAFDLTTSIQNESQLNSDILIFPNPCNKDLNIESNQFKNNEVVIELIDMTGKRILQIDKTPDDIIQIDVSDIVSGIYLIRIYDGNAEWKMDKIIIQH